MGFFTNHCLSYLGIVARDSDPVLKFLWIRIQLSNFSGSGSGLSPRISEQKKSAERAGSKRKLKNCDPDPKPCVTDCKRCARFAEDQTKKQVQLACYCVPMLHAVTGPRE